MTQPMPSLAQTCHASPAGAATEGPVTRVQLVHLPAQLHVQLRFGRPMRVVQMTRQRRVALFGPGAVFCRVRRDRIAGDVRWQLMVLMTSASQARTQAIDGISPGVLVLVRADGESQVNPVLQHIGAIGAQGIDAADVAPAYWRTLHNRLSAGMALPDYTLERHAGYLATRVIR